MSIQNKYPTLRYVAERLTVICNRLMIDYSTAGTRAERLRISNNIEELRSHVRTLLHYATFVPISDDSYPRTLDDVPF